MNSLIFISHTHAGRQIADTLRQHLSEWGVEPGQIFQSSTRGRFPSIGKGIVDELVRALTEAKLVVVIYTGKDQDWSWCMWECGVAIGPGDSQQTRIFVLQCADDSPAPFNDQVRLQLTAEGVEQFTSQFHKLEGFLPGLPAFAPWIAGDVLRVRARRLYEDLTRVVAAGAPQRSVSRRDDVAIPQGGGIDQVFLCHSSTDKPAVRALYQRLREDGFNPWLDEEDLLGGQRWREEIPRVLRDSDAVIICLSRNCVTKAG